MANEEVEFIECTSLNLSYNIMGIVTITYVVVHNTRKFVTYNTIDVGGTTFKGYVVNASLNQIPNTENWFETHVTLIATSD